MGKAAVRRACARSVLAELPTEEIVALGNRCIETIEACISVQNAIWWLEAKGVYRFGGAELHAPELASETVTRFFSALFRRHGLLK